ncbi:MAG: YcxB family protein [Clostridia bacterium]|nr:YcxB family protein [Clostridia bacterium]
MEMLFENRYVRTEQDLKAFYFRYYFGAKYLIIDVIFALFGLYMVLPDVYYAVIWGFPFDASILLWGIYVFIMPVVQLIAWKRMVRITQKREAEALNGRDPEIHVSVYADEIHMGYAAIGDSILPYTKVKKIRQTKNLIILYSGARLGYVLRKDAFTVGSYPDFIDFLRSKGFKVK